MFLCNLTSKHNSETLRANFCYGNMSVSLTERKLSFPYLVIDLIFKGVMNLIISPFSVVFLWLLAAAVDNGNSTGLTAWSIPGLLWKRLIHLYCEVRRRASPKPSVPVYDDFLFITTPTRLSVLCLEELICAYRQTDSRRALTWLLLQEGMGRNWGSVG